MSTDTRPVLELRVNPPENQRRWTVFFRSLLAIPHFIVLGVVSYAALVAGVIGWFALLFTGRNPLHRFTVGYLRWHARAYAYAWLLTDCYPPFSVEADETYPIDLTLEVGALSRLSVLFRIILAIPAYLVVACLMAGASVFGFVGWLITMFRGSLPTPLHDAFRATLRFALRTEAYVLLVQHRFPGGLFGERANEEALNTAASTVALSSAIGASEPVDLAHDGSASLEASGQIHEGSPAPGAPSTIILARGAKRVLIGELITGVVVFVAYALVIALVASTLSSGRFWYDNYGGRVSTIQVTVSTTIDDIAATPPNWAVIAHDCAQVSDALSAIAQVRQYPIARPNTDLLAGIAEITIADHACVANIAPGHLTHYLPELAQAFASGNARLAAFTNAIP